MHQGSKPAHVVFLKNNKIFSTGFSKRSERQYALWDEVGVAVVLVVVLEVVLVVVLEVVLVVVLVILVVILVVVLVIVYLDGCS